jgi:hypothetical protein
MPTKRDVVRDMLTGERDMSEALFDVPATDGGGTGPLDEEWKKSLDALRERFQAAPEAELVRYRLFFDQPDLTLQDLEGLLGSITFAVEKPEAFHDAVKGGEPLFGAVGDALSCAGKIPRWFPTRAMSAADAQRVAALRATYGLTPEIAINPNEHTFETCDPRWWPLLLEKGEEWVDRWPGGLAPYAMHTAQRSFVYEARADLAKPVKVALMADFGTGSYHSRFIARQLAAHRYPYVFHLGDVYYGGTQREFDDRYAEPLEQVLQAKSRLFSLPENHELYGEGKAYLAFLERERAAGRIDQEGSYFCLRFPEHQFIGVDVNWNGRQKFRHPPSQAWLTKVLREGRGRTTILLTGSGPYVYGQSGSKGLLEDMTPWSEQGHFHMWFWGDNHYCALFERDADKANFFGSCIGHAGYPGGRRKLGSKTFMQPIWVETEPRFPTDSGLRQDMGNNGWLEMTLLDGGGVELLYVDWLACKRFQIRFQRENDFMGFHLVRQGQPTEFGRDTLHKP